MSFGDIGAPAAWLLAALAMGAAELVIPGVFLVFLALAAAVVAAMTAAIPDLPLPGQLLAFAAWSAVAVVVGNRFYRDHPVATEDALLNDRAARLLGEVVTVADPIEHGRGRVRVGDSIWLARGPEAEAGQRVRVLAVDGAVLVVEPVEP